MIRGKWLLAFLAGIAGLQAQARVFNPKNESLAAYVSGTWGPSFENTLNSSSNSTAGTTVTLDSNHKYNRSGEFGFIYASPRTNLRFGLEVIVPTAITESKATDASGTELYSLTSEISVLIPKAVVEINFLYGGKHRYFLGLGGGYANLAGRNSYALTAAGNTAYPGQADFYEDLRGYATMLEGSLGMEGLLSDMTTYVFHIGYRSLSFDEIKHNRDVAVFGGSSVVKGDVATNIDGTNRVIDLSNYYAGIAFRFWIH